MENMKYINSLKEEDIIQCIHCGLCLPHCPTYALIGKEMDSPRGRIALMKAVNDGELTLTKKFTQHMYVCLECLACKTVCPAGVQYGRLIEEARGLIEDNRKQPVLKKYALKSLLGKPDKIKKYTKLMKLYNQIGLQFLVRKSKALSVIPYLNKMEQYLPELPRYTFKERYEEFETGKGGKSGNIGFYLGCVMNTIMPDTSSATVEILREFGYDVYTPFDVKCCGAPHINLGDLKTAKEFARHNIDAFYKSGFDQLDAIVTDCAGCGLSLKDYAHYLEDDEDYREKAAKFSKKVMDINEFLFKNVESNNKFKEIFLKVTYDDPCHLIHGQGISKAPRELIKMIPGVEYVELPEADWCCGSAGTYAFLQSKHSEDILDRKLEHIKNLRVNYVLTSNPGCFMQLDYGIRTRKLNFRVAHIMDFLGESIIEEDDD